MVDHAGTGALANLWRMDALERGCDALGAVMSAPIVRHPAADPAATWPGVHAIDPTGERIARDMLEELERVDMDEHDMNPAEYCQLENWVRQDRPFRNIVAEYAAKAQAAGPEALAGFYAVVSDFIARAAQN